MASTDDQIQGDLKRFLKVKNVCIRKFTWGSKIFKMFKSFSRRKISRIFKKKKNFPKDYNDFVGIWSSLSEEAKSLCNDPKYDYDEEKYKYEFIYFEVYCNVYLRYSLGLLF